jgi:nucleoside-diphosphate-sugar epimerase
MKLRDFSKYENQVKNDLKDMRKHKKKKIVANTIMVVGANGYVGWASVCQLAYKLPGVTIIAVDKYCGSRNESITRHYPLSDDRMDYLYSMFDFSPEIVESDMSDYEECETVLTLYRPDMIINLADGNKKENPVTENLIKSISAIPNYNGHLVLSVGYNSKRIIPNTKYPITVLKTANVIGTCNLVTLTHPILSTYNSPHLFLNKMIVSAFRNKKMVFKDGYVPVISLEDISRAFVKLARREPPENNKIFSAAIRTLTKKKIAEILKVFFKADIYIQGSSNVIPKVNNIKNFKSLIDKSRPPIENLIFYSCKNYMRTKK